MVEPPKLDWSGWSDEEKPLDKGKPFHRFKCPTIRGPQANGRGYDCGCRIPADVPFDSLLEEVVSLKRDPRNVIRTTPSWVPDGDNIRSDDAIAPARMIATKLSISIAP